MRLLIVRHAVAGDRDEFARTGEPDALRPLTPAGIRKMRRNVLGLRALLGELDVLGASPLIRARQTADLLCRPFGIDQVASIDALVPGRKPVAFVHWLASLVPTDATYTAAVVGHEPHLGQLIAFLLTGRRTPFMELKKGGACLLDLGERVAPGEAELVWCAPPKLLRAVARAI